VRNIGGRALIDWTLRKLGITPRIVTDGKLFAVAKGRLYPEMLDLSDWGYWWSTEKCQRQHCWGTLEQAKEALAWQEGKKYWDYKEEG
jgi:hypothetical protein